MSENSDFGGANNLSSGGNKTGQASAKPALTWSNSFVFMAAISVIILAIIFTSLYALVPTLMPLPAFVFGLVVCAAGMSTLMFSLFSRAEKAAFTLNELTQPNSLVGTLTDKISDLENQNRELKRFYQEERQRAQAASNAKTAFLAHLSHNFRTPLTHIIGFADMLTHQTYGPLGDKRYLSYIRDIKKSGEGLLTAVSDVLDLADLVKGSRAYAFDKISVSELFGGIKTRFGMRAERCGLCLEIDTHCSASLSGDRVSYERLLECLIDNSLKFTPAGGRIKLAAWEAEDGVVLEVTDTGIGIEKGRLKKLMQPFFHDEASISQRQMSMGLGLSIAKSIAELSGGEMAIDSSPSLGTTVVVTLPLVAKLAAKHTQAA